MPAVSVRRSVQRDLVVCLDCGFRSRMLRRHLRIKHGLEVADYRARWKLSADHPPTAPSYSAHRSALAKQLGLAARRAKPTDPVGVGGASSGETSRAQAEPTSDDLTGGGAGTRAEAAGAQAASIGCGVAEVQRSGHPGNRRGKTRPSWAAFSPPSISCIRRLETVFAPRGDPPGSTAEERRPARLYDSGPAPLAGQVFERTIPARYRERADLVGVAA